jgi:hypothetical protein
MHFAKTKRRRKHSTSDSAHTGSSGSKPAGGDAVQGEGNYEAAREFNAAQRKFVQSGKVDAAARAAAPRTDDEKQQMLDAEETARSRAKEDYPPPPEASPHGTDAARSEPSKDAPRRRQ